MPAIHRPRDTAEQVRRHLGSEPVPVASVVWRDRGVIGEADGWGKYVDLDILREEKRREDALRDLGLVVVRWTSDEVRRTPDLVLARIRRALTR